MHDTAYQKKQQYGQIAVDALLRLAFGDMNTAKRVFADLTAEDMPRLEYKRLLVILGEQLGKERLSPFQLESALAEDFGAETANAIINNINNARPLKDDYTHLIEHVKTATKWRLFADVSYEMGDWRDINDLDENLGDWIPRLQAVMDTETDPASTTATIQELLPEFVAETHRLSKLKNEITGLSTGYKMLDSYLNGLESATLTVIGAKTSIGKSLVGLNLAVGAMQQINDGIDRRPYCVLFTLEMSKQQVIRRLCANLGSVPFDVLKKPKNMVSTHWTNYQAGVVKMKGLPLTIVEGGKSIEQICAEARRLHIKGQMDFMLIDHLHNIRYSGSGNPQSEIKHITGRLVDLKNELGIPIILLAQCNRAAGTEKAPTKENLEGAGAIEQGADNIIMLHRRDKYIDPADMQTPRTNIIELISGKEREGEPFYLRYGFDGAHQRLCENVTDVVAITPFDNVGAA